jgi:chromosomal replication initiator protein
MAAGRPTMTFPTFRRPSINAIDSAVASLTGIGINLLRRTTHEHAIAHPRHLAMYLARELMGYSYSEIGEHYGGYDHSTVFYACKQIEKKRHGDAELQAAIDLVREQVRA